MARSTMMNKAALVLALALFAACAQAEPLCVADLKVQSSHLTVGGSVLKPIKLKIRSTGASAVTGSAAVAFNSGENFFGSRQGWGGGWGLGTGGRLERAAALPSGIESCNGIMQPE
jgi:hypothetical protein